MLLLDYEFFDCVEVVVGFVPALKDAAIGSLSQFLQNVVFFKKGVVVEEILIFRELAADGIVLFKNITITCGGPIERNFPLDAGSCLR